MAHQHPTHVYEVRPGGPSRVRSVVDWIEYRLPIFSLINNSVGANYQTPRNLNYWWNFGSIAGICLVIQILSGLFLAMHYTAHVDHAFDSVEHIMRDVNYGWMIRYMHAVGASMFFAVTYIHIARTLYYGSYKSPREILWWLGIIIFLMMMATAFMGYVLPWGQMSFWGATVITSLFSAIPGVGESVVHWLWGGFSVDNPTLNRFYALHYLLPFLLVGMVILHIWALHTHGSSNPLGINVQGPQDTIPFHPYYTIKDAFGLGVFFLIFAWFLFFSPNSLGHPDNYIPANPLSTPTHIVPEWYFLPFYAILRAVPDKLLGVISMFSAILILFALPWIDRSKIRSASFRPTTRILFWVFLADFVLLGYVGSQSADWGVVLAYCSDEKSCAAMHESHAAWLILSLPAWFATNLPRIVISGVATLYYFAHFFLLNFVSQREKTLPLPESIGKAVLASHTPHH